MHLRVAREAEQSGPRGVVVGGGAAELAADRGLAEEAEVVDDQRRLRVRLAQRRQRRHKRAEPLEAHDADRHPQLARALVQRPADVAREAALERAGVEAHAHDDLGNARDLIRGPLAHHKFPDGPHLDRKRRYLVIQRPPNRVGDGLKHLLGVFSWPRKKKKKNEDDDS